MSHSRPTHPPQSTRRAKWIALALTLALLPASSRVLADEADDQYAVASGHYSQGNWKFAAEEFLTFLTRYPEHRSAADARFFLGESLVQLGRFDEATQRFKAYLKAAPQGRFAKQARFRAGESAHFAGTDDVAGHELTLFRAEHPDDPLNQYVLTYLGEIAAEEGKPDEAALHFNECLKRFPEGELQDDCRLGLAKIFEVRGDSAEALRILEALAGKPKSPVAEAAWFRLGALHYALKQYEPAAEAFEKLIRDFPGSPKSADARLAHGWSLFKLGQFDAAIAAFDALSTHPRLRTEAGYWKGISQKNARRWADAAKTLRQTAAEAGKHLLAAELRFHAADAALRAGEIAEARKQFEAVVNSDAPEAEPWKDDARLGLIQVAFAEKRYDSVLERTEKLLASGMEPNLADRTALLRAKALIMSARHEAAAAILEALEGSDEAKFLLATAYVRLGRADDARRLFRAVAETNDSLQTQATLGEAEVLRAEGAHDEAIGLLKRLLEEKNPDGSDRFETEAALCAAYAGAGRFDEARAMHSRWAKARPVPAGLAAATEKLAEIAFQAKAYEEALAYFSWLALESADPDYREKGLLGQGWCEYELGRADAAGGTFARVVDNGGDPSRGAEAALARGRLLALGKREDAALAMFNLVIERYPNTPFAPQALLASARLLTQLKQFDQAESRYAALLDTYPDHATADVACYERAWALYDLDRLEDAYEAFRRVYEKYPDGKVWADATYRLAKATLDSGNTEKAERLTDEILAKVSGSPAGADALSLKWRIAAARQDWTAVDAAAARLLKEYPEHRLKTAAEFWRAEAAFRQDDRKAAEERFDALWNRFRGSSEDWVAAVRLRRAQLAAGAGQWETVRQIAAETKEQFPDFPQKYELDYLVGRSFAAEGNFTRAREEYARVLASESGGKTETAARAQWQIGETFFHQEDFDAAAKAFLRVDMLYDYPQWQAAALLEAGKCFEKLNQADKAAEQYRKLLERFPQDRYAEHARGRLDRLK